MTGAGLDKRARLIYIGAQANDARKAPWVKVGDDIECTCPRCKVILSHTVLFFGEDGRIGAVQCRTCGLQQPYRSHGHAGLRSPPPSPKMLRALVEGGSFAERVSRLDQGAILPYDMGTRFRAKDTIMHPRFGIGFVLRVLEGKMEVLFREGVKLLVHGAGPPGQGAPGAEGKEGR